MQSAALVKAMIDMPAKHYEAIGPLCRELEKMMQLARSVIGGETAQHELFKSASDAVLHGIETVSFSYVICHLRDVWPREVKSGDITSPAQSKNQVEQLRSEVKDRNVRFTDEIEAEFA